MNIIASIILLAYDISIKTGNLLLYIMELGVISNINHIGIRFRPRFGIAVNIIIAFQVLALFLNAEQFGLV